MKKYVAIAISVIMILGNPIFSTTAEASENEPFEEVNGGMIDPNTEGGMVDEWDAQDEEELSDVDDHEVPALAVDIPMIIASNGQAFPIGGVNASLEENKLFLFMSDYHERKFSVDPGWTAAIIDDDDGNYLVRMIVSKTAEDGAETIHIPNNGFILLGYGPAADFMMANLQENSEIMINGVSLPVRTAAEDSRIILEDGTEHAIDELNPAAPLDSGIAIYSLEYGTTTPSFMAGTIEYIIVNDIVVLKNTLGRQGTRIPSTGYVLSLSGSAVETVGSLNVGDSVTTVNVYLPTLPSNYVAIEGLNGSSEKVYLGITKFNTERDSGDVVLFDPSFGLSTGRNAWGMEFAFVDGVVTQVTNFNGEPNNTAIPADGYVLSVQIGHQLYDQLNGRLKIGDRIELVREQFTYQASRTNYDAYNPKVKEDNPAGWDELNDEPYGGFRGANQLIVYDSDYGQETTGTNGYGNEVVVNEQGYVIRNGGNNSIIPPGGIVLSGHGKFNTWLVQHAAIGSKVLIQKEKKQVTIISTPESFLERAEIDLATVGQRAAAAKAQFLDVPYQRIETVISEAEALLQQIKETAATEGLEGQRPRLDELNRLTTEAYYLTFESRKVDHRALWLRPKETNLQQVMDHLDQIKAVNINSIYLETWWNGYTSYATEHSLTAMNPINKGFDVLDAYITEGHKRGIEIHAWVHNFFILPGAPVLEYHPEWLMYTREIKPDGEVVIQPSPDQTGLSLNPVDPGARQFVLEIYEELLSKYNVDGLHHDYGRYPGSPANYSKDYGYEDYTRSLFEQEHGIDPAGIFPGDEKWDEWVRFRINAINSFIELTVHEAKKLKPDIKITAAVWPNYDEAPYTHYQEVENWLDHNLLDNTFHMSYMPDWSVVVEDLERTIKLAKNKSFSTSAVGTFNNLTHTALMEQLDQVNRHGAAGTGIFEFESLFIGGYGDIIRLGSHRESAVMPDHRRTEPVLLMLKELVRKIDEIYVPYQGMGAEDAKSVANIANTLEADLSKTSEMKLENAIEVKTGVKKIRSAIVENRMIDEEVRKRIEHDLAFIDYMLDVYAAKTEQSLEPIDPGKPVDPSPGTGSDSSDDWLPSYTTPAPPTVQYTVPHTDGVRVKDTALITAKNDVSGNMETAFMLRGDALREALTKLGDAKSKRIVVELTDEADTIKFGIPFASFVAGAKLHQDAIISIRTTDTVFEFPLSLKGLDSKFRQLDEPEQDAAIYAIIEKNRQRPAINKGEFASDIYKLALVIAANGKEIGIDDRSNPLIQRMIIVNRLLDAKIATAVAADALDGKLSFVPSLLRTEDGKTIVTILHSTNGRYAVIQSARTFADLAGHWAQTDIERLASKRIVQGVGDNAFNPNAKITRAEFASLLVRSIGLTEVTEVTGSAEVAVYSDVERTEWFAEAIETASGAGIIKRLFPTA